MDIYEDFNTKIDQIAQTIKDSAAELEEEVIKIEDATTTVYKSLVGILNSVQTMSNTLFAAVEKGFGRSDDDQQEERS